MLLAATSARAGTLAEIPFEFRDGYLWVEVSVAGQHVPLHFLVDSGAAASVVSADAARRLDLRLGRPQVVQGVGRQSTAFHVSHFDATVGGVALPRSVLALDLRAVSATCHRPIDGLLGADFFRSRVVRIDFAAEKINILDRATAESGSVMLPMKLRNGAICVPAMVAGRSSQWLRLDTGCDSALEWVVSDTRAQRGHETSVALTSAGKGAIRLDVQLGTRTMSGVKAGLYRRQLFLGEDGLLGNGLLGKFCVTVDFPGRRVILD